ncbi:MAG: MtN3 and saliva related transmembrane protein [Myxococcota bacterium]|jgi:MtN3 and saliva related transmembrane protein
MEVNYILIFNVLGACLTTLSFIPQTIKTIKTRDTSGISLLMYVMFVLGVFFWGLFGVLINNLPMIVANAITLLLSGTVLIIKIYNSLHSSKKENFIIGKILKKKN